MDIHCADGEGQARGDCLAQLLSGRVRPGATALALPPVGAGQPQMGAESACWSPGGSRRPCACSQCPPKPADSIPASWFPPTLEPTQSARQSYSPWKSLVIPAFPNPGKVSESRILPPASRASWPVSTSLASSLPPSPFFSALLAKRLGLVSAP